MVIAYKNNKKTNCIIIWGWKDFILGVITLLGCFIAFTSDNITLLFCVFIMCAITTIAFSIISNFKYAGSKWLSFSVISIFTKIAIMIITPIIIPFIAPPLLLIAILTRPLQPKVDRRFKTGYKNNAVPTRDLGLSGTIFNLLIHRSLIKTGADLVKDE
jgi:hypothetical protein